jgi:phosphate transport system protein
MNLMLEPAILRHKTTQVPWYVTLAVPSGCVGWFESMPSISADLDSLKQKLLVMSSHAESAVNRAVRAMLRRDDDLARRIDEDDSVIDKLEMEIDHAVLESLTRRPASFDLRLITAVMKIARELERVGDEATTISRRCIELSHEPPLKFQIDVQRLARLSLEMLKDALDAFVSGDAARARHLVGQDDEVDRLHKQLQRELAGRMAQQPENITRCLQLMVVTKSLERIGDHATNIAELVVYLYEGRDIRHARPKI